MAEPIPTPIRSPRSAFGGRLAAVVCAVVCVGVATGFWVMTRKPGEPSVIPTPGATDKPIAATPGPLFTNWPKATPELAIVLTGQTYGYLSPCGCSRPQKGGLERRANFVESFRAKGWEVVGLDLGDVVSQKGLPEQNLLKYRATMRSLAAMGYAAVGLGEYDFQAQLFELLGGYTLQNPNAAPIVLGANLVGVGRDNKGNVAQVFPRESYFPGGGPKTRPLVEDVEVIAPAGKPAIAVVGILGKDFIAKLGKIDDKFGVAEAKDAIQAALAVAAKHPAKPRLNVLLYAGTFEQATAAAKAFPQFQLVVCQSEESEPPQFPTPANDGKTLVVQVGHKGQNVGVVGVFKAADGGTDLRYQLVPLGEEYITPADKVKGHKVLGILEDYAAAVEKDNLLAVARAKPALHQAQVELANLKPTYVGAAACAKCHAAEFAVWNASKHAHAYEALVKAAERPSKRQFDPECVTCHTTGFQYEGGFADATKSANLLGNQCENCHGPGSAHAAAPNNRALYKTLLPWAAKAGDRLPKIGVFEAAAKAKARDPFAADAPLGKLNADQKRHFFAVQTMCMRCHDGENDPKFDLIEYFPKIHHSGLKNNGLPPGVGK